MRAGPKAAPSTPNRTGEIHAAELAGRERHQRMAVRVIASRANGVEDCRELLAMLGLSGVAGLPVVDPPVRR